MANGRVEFEMSIKGLTFKYKGDQSRAQVLQEKITDTLSALAEAQGSVINIEPRDVRVLPPAPSAAGSPKRRRRTKAKGAANGSGTAAVGAAEVSSESPDGQKARNYPKNRRAKGTSYFALVKKLTEDDFLTKWHTGEDVRTELERLGHNFELKRVNEALVKLTKDEVLTRQKNEAEEWVYKLNK